ncbi:MAG: U32 family peptidase [Lentisphaeria bacterium]|nr:U32 family peptidase [Lentisphaeria bacterium]
MMELLAPAGNLECALAAFDEGADAVYAGLKKFNARERTENFSDEEMSKLIAYARKHGRKVYVTFNTLIKENELDEAAAELARLEILRPDAVIVQDAGVVHLARKYFPTLALHGSTQMSLHNSAGLQFAKELGLSRVILERQTTLAELEAMMKTHPPVEVEIFIHGALCCCISGTCLLSSWLGGWSGNRGKCKQPCRRRHRSADGNGFFLSAQDLETLEILPRLLKTGVSAFKIEGRLRRSDYVSHVVAAYRMAMDAAACSDEDFRAVLPSARARLARTLGRKWSLGYYTQQSAENLIKHDSLGVSGLLCGKVMQTSPNGFSVSVGRPVFEGDMIRVQPASGDEGPAFRITKMSRHGRPVTKAGRGNEIFICSDKEIPRDGLVYKIGEKTPDYSARIASLPRRKTVLDLDIFFSRRLCRVSAGGQFWEQKLELQEAAAQTLQPDRIEQEFARFHSEQFEAGKISVRIEEKPFLPASVLKSIRKKWEEEFLPLVAENPTDHAAEALKAFRADYAKIPDRERPEVQLISALVPRGKYPELPEGCRIIREISDAPSPHEELLLPYYISEFDLPEVRESLHRWYEKGGRTVRISSLSHLALTREYPDLILKTCMPLPICNSLAAAEMAEHGVAMIQGSLELGAEEWCALARKSPLPCELYCFGRPVLLSTRAKLPVHGMISDSKGERFQIEKKGILTRILAEKVMSVPVPGEADALFYDYLHATGKEKDQGRFNFDISLA